MANAQLSSKVDGLFLTNNPVNPSHIRVGGFSIQGIGVDQSPE